MIPTRLWLPIEYRDFWDVPRIFVVEIEGKILLFDCPFDETTDDYSSEYTVYRLSTEVDLNGTSDWRRLPLRGEQIGKVPVAELRFDETKRHFVDRQTLRAFVS